MIDFTITDIQNSIDSLEELRDKVEQQKHKISESYDSLKSKLERRISETERDIGVANGDLNHARAIISENQSARTKKEQELHNAEAERNRLLNEIESLRRQESEARIQMNSLSQPSQSDYPPEQQSQYYAAMQRYRQEKEYLQSVIAGCTRKIEENRQRIEQLDKLILKLKADIQKIDNNIASLKHLIEEINSWIGKLKEYRSALKESKESCSSAKDRYDFSASQSARRISFCGQKEESALQIAVAVVNGLQGLSAGSGGNLERITFSNPNVLADMAHNFTMLHYSINDSSSHLDSAMRVYRHTVIDNVSNKTGNVIRGIHESVQSVADVLNQKAAGLRDVHSKLISYTECKI